MTPQSYNISPYLVCITKIWFILVYQQAVFKNPVQRFMHRYHHIGDANCNSILQYLILRFHFEVNCHHCAARENFMLPFFTRASAIVQHSDLRYEKAQRQFCMCLCANNISQEFMLCFFKLCICHNLLQMILLYIQVQAFLTACICWPQQPVYVFYSTVHSLLLIFLRFNF